MDFWRELESWSLLLKNVNIRVNLRKERLMVREFLGIFVDNMKLMVSGWIRDYNQAP